LSNESIIPQAAGEFDECPTRALWHGREFDFGQNFIWFEGGSEHKLEEVECFDPAFATRANGFETGIEGQGDNGKFGSRVRMSQGAADGAPVTNLGMGDTRDGLAQEGDTIL
jgi:hypothetical protein